MQTPSPKYEVSCLTSSDICWFVEVAAVNMLTHELKRPNLININQLYVLAEKCIEDKTAFIVKKEQVNVGALGSILLPNLFNPELTTLAEVFWYVLPEYRSSRAGLLLLNSFDKRASEMAHDSTLSLLPSSTVNNKSLSKKGFNLVEMGFRKSYGEI